MKRIDLAGEWTLLRWEERADKQGSGIPFRVPGDTVSALIEAGKIPDRYFGTNELESLWVGRTDWLLCRSLSLEREFLEDRQIFLHLDSLDTVAEIRINGKPAAASANMFRALRIDVGKFPSTWRGCPESSTTTSLPCSRTIPRRSASGRGENQKWRRQRISWRGD